MKKNKHFLLGVGVSNLSKDEVLEEIKKWLTTRRGFCQIVTVNPEFLVLAQKEKRFKTVLNSAQIATADGIGTLLAGKILGTPFKEKVAGITLMEEMIKRASDCRLTVGLIGGKSRVALETAECLKKEYPNFDFFALEGAKDVKNETLAERAKIMAIIRKRKPQMLFVGFGAPWQDCYIDSLKKDLGPIDHPLIAVGVGGSFDEMSGRIKRAPNWVGKLGFKWLWRLIVEPWRWRRQLALIEFAWLVFKQKRQSWRQ